MYNTTGREQLKRDVISAFHNILKDKKMQKR